MVLHWFWNGSALVQLNVSTKVWSVLNWLRNRTGFCIKTGNFGGKISSSYRFLFNPIRPRGHYWPYEALRDLMQKQCPELSWLFLNLYILWLQTKQSKWIKTIMVIIRTYLLVYIWSEMLSSSWDLLLKLSETTYSQKLFPSD